MKKKLVALGLAVLTTASMVAGGTLSVMAESDETSGVITMEKSDASGLHRRILIRWQTISSMLWVSLTILTVIPCISNRRDILMTLHQQ